MVPAINGATDQTLPLQRYRSDPAINGATDQTRYLSDVTDQTLSLQEMVLPHFPQGVKFYSVYLDPLVLRVFYVHSSSGTHPASLPLRPSSSSI